MTIAPAGAANDRTNAVSSNAAEVVSGLRHVPTEEEVTYYRELAQRALRFTKEKLDEWRNVADLTRQIDTKLSRSRELQEKLTALQESRPRWEADLNSLSETLRFHGCRCVLDEKRGECRLESIQTGRFRAKIEYTKTCAADCRRWYADESIRRGCATSEYLKETSLKWEKNSKTYSEIISDERKTFEEIYRLRGESEALVQSLNSSRRLLAGPVVPWKMDLTPLREPDSAIVFPKPHSR